MESPLITSVRTELIAYFYEERPSFKLPEDVYDSWAILMCEQGEFEYRLGDEAGEVRAGEFVLCPPGQPLFRKTEAKLIFHFSRFRLKTFCHEEEVDFPYSGKITCRNTMRVRYTMEQLKEARRYFSIYNVKYIEHLLNDILYQFLGERALLAKERKPDDPDILEAVRYLHEHAYSKLTLQEVAQHVGLSSSQFTRKFQNVMSVSPIKYLTQLRLQKACSLLIGADPSLELVAEQSGYQNAFYLSRVFTRELGMSPSHYRNLHRV